MTSAGRNGTTPSVCPRGCVDTDGCGCEWNAKHEKGSLFPFGIRPARDPYPAPPVVAKVTKRATARALREIARVKTSAA